MESIQKNLKRSKSIVIKFCYIAILLGLPTACFFGMFYNALLMKTTSLFFVIERANAVKTDLKNGTSSLVVRRDIHKYFMTEGLYLPLEDIVLDQDEPYFTNEVDLSRKACGRGDVYLWLYAPIKLPIVGTKVIEWCEKI